VAGLSTPESRDKQLFLDDDIIESLDGAVKRLDQPTKYPGNPGNPVILSAWSEAFLV